MFQTSRNLISALTLIGLFGAAPALAGVDETLAEIRQELNVLMLRIEALEAENRELKERGSSLDATVPSNTQSVSKTSSPGGYQFQPAADFRLRYEAIDVDGSASRERARIRLRASVARKVSENVKLEFGIATGGDSPTSSTQTLGGGGSKKDLAVDLAYIDWQPAAGLHILAGKFRNPLFQVPSQTMLWDDEWRPEGIGVSFTNESFFASLLGTWLESDSLTGNREFTAGVQTGLRHEMGAVQFTAGLGYFDFGVSGSRMFFGSGADFGGNTFECATPLDVSSCTYVHDYREMELFTAMNYTAQLYSAGLYAHYVRNTDADRFNDGWTIGSKFRFTALEHPLELNYFYRDIEADAVFAQLADSDFGGGGTDSAGHYFKAGWQASRGLLLSVTWFDNDIGSDLGDPKNYQRVQLNADFSF